MVTVYSTPTCPWCKKTKAWLKKNKIKFKDIDITKNDKARNKMIDISGQMGVPVVVIKDTIIVGFNEKAMKKALQ